jgi:hypothetical protein
VASGSKSANIPWLISGTSTNPARSPEMPAVRVDDGAGDRQTHAHPVRLGGEEGVEDPVVRTVVHHIYEP